MNPRLFHSVSGNACGIARRLKTHLVDLADAHVRVASAQMMAIDVRQIVGEEARRVQVRQQI